MKWLGRGTEQQMPRWHLVIPAGPRRDFFQEVIAGFAAAAPRNAVQLVICVAPGEYDEGNWVRETLRAWDSVRRGDALILVPYADNCEAPAGLRQHFARSHLHIPVVTLDVRLLVDRVTLPFVMGDDRVGGEHAGRAAVWYGQKRRLTKMTVGILPGRWGSDRVTGFLQELHRNYASSDIQQVVLPAGNWTPEYGTATVMEYAGRPGCVPLDLIFCCNDLMAIGARQAISNLRKKNNGCLKDTRVIGYDGADIVRRLLASEDEILINTVEVAVEDMVKGVEELISILRTRYPASLDDKVKYRTIAPKGTGAPRTQQDEVVT